MKHTWMLLLVIVFCSNTWCQDVVQYVQPLSGTAAATTPASLKHGGGSELNANTIPSVTVPFAMTQWAPQTRATETKCLPPYFYKDSLFSGFRATHWLSGSCVQDYGSVTIMPVTGKLQTDLASYATPFSHQQEIATPYFYSVELPRYNLTASMTATRRCGLLQFINNGANEMHILVTPNSDYAGAFIKVDSARGEIYGYNPVHRIYQGWGEPAGFSGYFVMVFDRPFAQAGTFTGPIVSDSLQVQNKKSIGAYASFNVRKSGRVQVRVGTSFSSLEGARKNLQAEIPGFNFENVKQQCRQTWQAALSKVAVTGSTEKNKRIFYTALYHALQHPRLYNDVDGTYPAFASNGVLKKISNGNYYDDFSMWDIYRAQLPLLEILYPDVVNDLVRSLILKGEQGGWMPIFPCWNSYTAAMIGDHAAPVIASAYLKGIRNYDAEKAYALLRQNAFSLPANRQDYINGKGRRALESYLQYGYIPLEDTVPYAFHKKEQVSRTLEYAYDDYTLAQLAKALNKNADHKLLQSRGNNFLNVIDTITGLARGRFANGSFVAEFNPDKKESFITEGTPRQYTFYAPHNIQGLARAMGGQNRFEAALDTLFDKNEYWHGNEPGHQIPYLYNFTASPWKTQWQVQHILAEEYSDGPGGLSGNDDAGQMSAWYVFSAMGMYPVDPVSGVFQLSTPLFNQVKISLGKQQSFVINKPRVYGEPLKVSAVTLNGKKLAALQLKYADLVKGGQLQIATERFNLDEVKKNNRQQ